MIHPDFDGHAARPIALMTPEERLDDLSAKARDAEPRDEAGRRPSR